MLFSFIPGVLPLQDLYLTGFLILSPGPPLFPYAYFLYSLLYFLTNIFPYSSSFARPARTPPNPPSSFSFFRGLQLAAVGCYLVKDSAIPFQRQLFPCGSLFLYPFPYSLLSYQELVLSILFSFMYLSFSLLFPYLFDYLSMILFYVHICTFICILLLFLYIIFTSLLLLPLTLRSLFINILSFHSFNIFIIFIILNYPLFSFNYISYLKS